MLPSYVYAATVLSVHDGDTITLSIRLRRSRGKDTDFGFHFYRENGWLVLHAPIRLLECNARELGEPGGPEAGDHLRTLLPAGTQVTIRSVATDKYARYDAAVTLADGTDLVTQLVADDWAAAWDDKGPRPLPPWPRPQGGAA